MVVINAHRPQWSIKRVITLKVGVFRKVKHYSQHFLKVIKVINLAMLSGLQSALSGLHSGELHLGGLHLGGLHSAFVRVSLISLKASRPTRTQNCISAHQGFFLLPSRPF